MSMSILNTLNKSLHKHFLVLTRVFIESSQAKCYVTHNSAISATLPKTKLKCSGAFTYSYAHKYLDRNMFVFLALYMKNMDLKQEKCD